MAVTSRWASLWNLGRWSGSWLHTTQPRKLWSPRTLMMVRDQLYSHALVARIDHYPHKVTASMGKKKTAKWSKIKSFVKVCNYNHLMPAGYSVDIPLLSTRMYLGVLCWNAKHGEKLKWKLKKNTNEQEQVVFPSAQIACSCTNKCFWGKTLLNN